jgi:hypothetical protein
MLNGHGKIEEKGRKWVLMLGIMNETMLEFRNPAKVCKLLS